MKVFVDGMEKELHNVIDKHGNDITESILNNLGIKTDRAIKISEDNFPFIQSLLIKTQSNVL